MQKLNDFPSTHWDANNQVLTYYIKLDDRTVSVALIEDLYVVCMNNINYDITFTDTSHKLYDYVGWDNTLLLDHCVGDLDSAMEVANRFIDMVKIPYLHPEYNDTLAA